MLFEANSFTLCTTTSNGLRVRILSFVFISTGFILTFLLLCELSQLTLFLAFEFDSFQNDHVQKMIEGEPRNIYFSKTMHAKFSTEVNPY